MSNDFDDMVDQSKPTSDGPVKPYSWLVIDGGGLAVTSWSTHRDLESPEDRVNATIYVFATSLASLSRLVAHEAKIVVAWDGKDNRAWRRGLHPWYKHGRGSVIDRQEVGAAIQRLNDLMRTVGIAQIVVNGREADDVVATLARRIERMDERVLIFSDDRDYVQLVNDHIHLQRRSLQGIIMRPGQCEVMSIRYGDDYLHAKAMMGDSGDNIKGLHGIGEKKAYQLIDSMPSFMANAIASPESIDWTEVDDTLRRAFYRAGRRLLWPPPLVDKEFADQVATRRGMQKPVEYDVDEDAALLAATKEIVRCLNLVELDDAMELPEFDFPEPNVEAIPRVMKAMGVGDESDLYSAMYTIAGMRGSVNTPPPMTSGNRAGSAIDEWDF